MTVPGPSNTTRGQDLAAQVWYLPHIRQSVFEELARDPSLNESPYTFLRRHLTLDKATFLDIAPMLYNSTSLDRFPLDCPDEDRKRVYAAGVRDLDLTGSIPLCGQWNSFTDMLDFFPNVNEVYFRSVGITFYKHFGSERTAAFIIDEVVFIEEDGSIKMPTSFTPPESLKHSVVRNIWCGWQANDEHRPFAVREDGELVIPEVLLQPARFFAVHPSSDRHEDWITILGHRRALGFTTSGIIWSMSSGKVSSVLPRLNEVVPRELLCLRLRLDCSGPLVSILDSLMGIIDNRTIPDLRDLIFQLVYNPLDLTEVHASPAGSVSTAWGANDLPSALRVKLELFFKNDGEPAPTDPGILEQVVLDSLPLLWIENARRALRHVGGSLCVGVRLRSSAGGSAPFEPPAVLAALKPDPGHVQLQEDD